MRVVICTLYFPPCTFTPANRIYSWARYLHQFGIYPIIITRQWPVSIGGDYFNVSVGNEIIIEKYDHYEVHYLPFHGNYRTRNGGKKGNFFKKVWGKINVAVELVFRYSFTKLLPYGNIFEYTDKYIQQNKVDKILISGSPFLLFKIGYQLFKKFNIPWIADYRDGWTTSNYREEVGVLTDIVEKLNKHFEKKWLATAESFVTVSDFLEKNIEQVTGRPGAVIYNGFYDDDQVRHIGHDKKIIKFLYSGTIYAKQDYKTMVTCLKKLIEKFKNNIDIQLIFLGTSYENPAFTNDPIFAGFENNIQLLDRVDYKKALAIHEEADAFIMLSHEGMKGIVSSKLFDYIKYKKPVVLFPDDGDVLGEILQTSRLGVIADNMQELNTKIENLVKEKMENGYINIEPDEQYINSFSRENQAHKLADILSTS